jgi:DUF917 family protein
MSTRILDSGCSFVDKRGPPRSRFKRFFIPIFLNKKEIFMKNLNRQDMEDLLSGGLILGCGGGGEPQVGEAFIDEAYRKGKDFYLIDIDEIKPEGIYCLVSYVGGGISQEEEAWVKDLKKSIEHPILKAVQELSRYVGKELRLQPCLFLQ